MDSNHTTYKPKFCIPVTLNNNFTIHNSNIENELQFIISANDRFYKINSGAYHLIKVIEKYKTVNKIAEVYSQKQQIIYKPDDIIEIINESLVPIGIIDTVEPIIQVKQKSFLFIKRRFFSQSALQPITSFLRILFKQQLAIPLLFIIVLTHGFLLINYYGKYKLINFADDPSLLLYTGIIFFLSTIFHEFGHASACSHFGIKHNEIGIGLYLTFPVFYANISNSWVLSARKRAVIDVAGIYFQYIFNTALFILFVFTKNEVFLYTIFAISIQTIITLNPFFRFDGYWLATDLLGIPNLRKRAMEYIQHIVQKRFFDKDLPEFKIRVSPIFKLLFFIYAIISNFIFIFFMIWIILKLPNSIYELIDISRNLIHSFSNYVLSSDWHNLWLLIYSFLARFVFVGVIVYFSFKLFTDLFRKTIKGYKSYIYKHF